MIKNFPTIMFLEMNAQQQMNEVKFIDEIFN